MTLSISLAILFLTQPLTERAFDTGSNVTFNAFIISRQTFIVISYLKQNSNSV